MEFLDPQKERLTRIALFVGYGLIALAIGIASIILLYTTDGYCVDGTGTVDRCGLVFVSSQPTGADVSINGKLKKSQTNTKFNLQSGTYQFRVSRDGYRDWQRTITVEGGDVQRFDYPFLFPQALTTTTTTDFTTNIGLATQSPDRRWLVLADENSAGELRLYDLKNPEKPVVTSPTLTTGLLTTSESTNSWKFIEWSNDNRHVLLQHSYVTGGAAAQEYILVDRQRIDLSRNLTKDLTLAATAQLSLFNKKYDQYYLYDTQARTLQTTALNGNAPTTTQLTDVTTFKTFGDDTILYVTATPPSGTQTEGTVSVVLQQGSRTIVLRELPSDAPKYLLDMAQYAGKWYVVLAASNQKGAYIYVDPFDQKLAKTTDLPRPSRFLKVAEPQYVAFSANTQFVLVQNGQKFGVYDIENDDTYGYTVSAPLDAPQEHATWMDGNRLVYTSGGKMYVFDYDNINQQTLQANLSGFNSFFSPDYTYVFNIQQQDTAQRLGSTILELKQ
ncbi:PEGA domain-containing protein [Candidatus Saccharibacteria bacterium]|nr:PEGA domain-containing protein [Candidatus Saccharibacteria bacterium]